jgi:hypothetical protein
MAGLATGMNKMLHWIKRRILVEDVKHSIAYSDLKRNHIRKAVDDIKTSLNGEDRWFLKVCDSFDPEEKECPPEYPDKPGSGKDSR